MDISPVGLTLLDKDSTPGVSPGTQVPSPQLIATLNQAVYAITTLWASGTTAERPPNPDLGQIYYDTSLPGFVYCAVPATNPHTADAVWLPLIGGGPVEVDDEGILLTATVAKIDFVGSGVTATAVGNDVTVDIPGGGVSDFDWAKAIMAARTYYFQ